MNESKDPNEVQDDAVVKDAAANSEDQTETSASELVSVVPRGPRVFGRFAFAITAIPYIVFLVCLRGGSYVEGVRDKTLLKHEKETAYAAVSTLAQYLDRLQKGNIPGTENYDSNYPDAVANEWKAREWHSYLVWDNFHDTFMDEDHIKHPEDLWAALKPFYGDKEGLNEPPFSTVRDEVTKFVSYWIDYDLKNFEREIPADVVAEVKQAGTALGQGEATKQKRLYPTYYTMGIAATIVAMMFVFVGYFKSPFRISLIAIATGLVGIVVWLGLWWIDDQFLGLGKLYPKGRPAFDPFTEIDNQTWRLQFLAIRFTGLVVVVPIVEEFFLRGFLMRYIDDPDWDEIPLGYAARWGIVGATAYGLLTHLTEPLAAIVWFSMITWLYLKTKNVWDCVVAHAVTNLLLGLFVVYTGTWVLW